MAQAAYWARRKFATIPTTPGNAKVVRVESDEWKTFVAGALAKHPYQRTQYENTEIEQAKHVMARDRQSNGR